MAKDFKRELEIKTERAAIFSGMSAIMEKVNTENRSLTVEERTEFDTREARLTELDADLDRVVKYNRREEERESYGADRNVSRDELESGTDAYTRAYTNWFKRGERGLSEADSVLLRDAGPLGTTAGTAAGDGGYLVPQGFWHNLQIALKAYGGILSLCKVVPTDTGNPMPWPTIDPTAIVGSYITENTQLGSQDFSFGQGMLNAWTITSNVILASLQIINDSAFDVDSFVSDRIGESIGRKVAAELITGSGSSALLGVQTALAAVVGSGVGLGGIYQPTAGAVVNTLGSFAVPPTQHSLTAGVPAFADLLKLIEYVDPAYRAMGNCKFVFNSNTLSLLRTVSDGYGHPLWNPNVQVGGNDDLYGYGYQIDQNVANISTTASTVGGLLFGDFSRAMVVRQVNQAGTMRLTERYADYLQVGYLGYVRMDARSNDLRAAVVYESPAS
jgi:HK97 family phage major capsid protein